jgi:capsular exopolysaccharide synthesis family protein
LNSFDYIQPVIRRWRLILLSVLVCAGVAAFDVTRQTRIYQSNAQLFASTRGTAAAADAVNQLAAGNQFTSARVQSYVDLISSPEITAPVVASLGLHMTPGELAGDLSASVPLNTVLINITAKAKSPQLARRIAAAVSRQYITVITQLESAPHQPAPVRVSVSSPASLDGAPVSPKKKIDIGIGVLVGLLLGIFAAQILERLDDTIKSDDELSKSYGLSTLARIPLDQSVREGLDSLKSEGAGARLEALRTLRTALRYIDVDNPPRCLVVTSCDAGAGKTATSATLAAVVADAGNTVVVLEGDLRRPSLREYLGATHEAVEGVAEVLGEGRDVTELLHVVDRPHATESAGTVSLLSSGRAVPNPSELLGSNRMRALIDTLRDSYDMVIIDAPPLLPVTDAAILATISDGVVFIVEYGRTTRSGLRQALGSLDQVDARLLGVVVNKAAAARRYRYGYGYTTSRPDEPATAKSGSAPQPE